MPPRPALLLLFATLVGAPLWAADAPGPFFESDQPFFHVQVEIEPATETPRSPGNFVVRGILLPLGTSHCALFDQELLRVAAVWRVPQSQPLVTLETMAQISYAVSTRKAAAKHPRPTGPLLLTTGAHPGVHYDVASLWTDPRPPARAGDAGRGALPPEFGRFDGLELQDAAVVLHYTTGQTRIREQIAVATDGLAPGLRITRRFEVSAHDTPLRFALGRGASLPLAVTSNSVATTLAELEGEMVATVTPSPQPHDFTVTFAFPGEILALAPKPTAAQRWPQTVTSPVRADHLNRNGVIVDHLAVPETNPWNRRVRAADLAFLSDDRAAVVTFDGDVWLVTGFAHPALPQLQWRRFASGLHEPLAIAAPNGIIQVATKNGVVRLHDRDGNGEADWFENFNDQMLQSQTTRSFPLDMAIGPDGSTFVTQGGIVTQSGLVSGGTGTEHTGAFLRISPDGRKLETFARGGREPFIAVHPVSGFVTGTDQQGHFIPSSVCYAVRPGDSFGFLENNPTQLTPPLVWIPHDQDISSTSQVWMIGDKMGPWNGRLLHLSYGTGRLLLIAPDLSPPIPQGAVIPLDLKTDLPLLHARMHPRGDAVYFTGFQIWGTQTSTKWSLGRLRPGSTPVTTALSARSVADGVILEFATPLAPAAVQATRVNARAWNYQRASTYGSGRYTLDGAPGTTPLGIAQTALSRDRKSVFVHLPGLPPVHQLEVRHDFQLANGAAARGAAYFTIHHTTPFDPDANGFDAIDLTQRAAAVAQVKEPPATVAIGQEVAQSVGCVACHSVDGSTEGKVGPTWRGLFGAKRTFIDGTTETADELYLREKILDPRQKKSKPGQIEMPSYRGVLSEQQLEALVLYIKSVARK